MQNIISTMAKAVGGKRGAKRNEPDQPEAPTFSSAKKAKTTSEFVPSITNTAIKVCKWDDARVLLLPFLSKEEKANIHKKTRADLSALLHGRVQRGDITPERFWSVVGQKKESKNSKGQQNLKHPAVAKAMAKNKVVAAASTLKQIALTNSTIPIAPAPTPIRVPLLPPPRPLNKYVLRVPDSICATKSYPPRIVIGEPNPPKAEAPPTISGTFQSSSILSIGKGDKVLHPNDAKKQTKHIFSRLDSLLSQLNATHSDVLSMTAHVVDIHKNGNTVLDAHGTYMAGKGKNTRSVCAWNMVGVSGLMPEGCVVQWR